MIVEIREALRQREAILHERDLYDVESMKQILDEFCLTAGVKVRLYTRLAATVRKERTITHVVLATLA